MQFVQKCCYFVCKRSIIISEKSETSQSRKSEKRKTCQAKSLQTTHYPHSKMMLIHHRPTSRKMSLKHANKIGQWIDSRSQTRTQTDIKAGRGRVRGWGRGSIPLYSCSLVWSVNQVRAGDQRSVMRSEQKNLTVNEAKDNERERETPARRSVWQNVNDLVLDQWIMRDIILNRCSNVKAKHRSQVSKKVSQQQEARSKKGQKPIVFWVAVVGLPP